MNNKRRKEIRNICSAIETETQKGNLNRDKIENLILDFENCVDEERDSLDNYPESLQETDQWEEYDENCDELSDIVSDLNDALDNDDDKDVVEELLSTLENVEIYIWFFIWKEYLNDTRKN